MVAWMAAWYVNNELAGIWKIEAEAQYIYFGICLQGLRRELSQDSRCPGRNSKRKLPEYTNLLGAYA
jgi:hypothetical protein